MLIVWRCFDEGKSQVNNDAANGWLIGNKRIRLENFSVEIHGVTRVRVQIDKCLVRCRFTYAIILTMLHVQYFFIYFSL